VDDKQLAVLSLAEGQIGTDQFTYTVTDDTSNPNDALTATAQFTVNIVGVNDAPVAVGDSLAVNENATTTNLAPLLLANDTDLDAGDTHTITFVNAKGTIGGVNYNLNPAAQFLSYSANAAVQDALAAGQTAMDSFSYTIADAHGATSSATVTV